MKIIFKNIHKLDSNFYQGIEINEFTIQKQYLVKFYGRDPWFDTKKVGNVFSNNLTNLLPEEQILAIIRKYIADSNITYFRDDVRTGSKYSSTWISANGTKNLLFNVRNKKLVAGKDLIRQKYIDDRYAFCYKNHKIQSIIINVGDFSQYGFGTDDNDKPTLKLVLNHNLNGLLFSWEYQFIKEYITDILSECNTEIYVNEIYDNKDNIYGFLIIAGNLKIYISNFKALRCILDIIQKYNEDLRKINACQWQRQLKINGF